MRLRLVCITHWDRGGTGMNTSSSPSYTSYASISASSSNFTLASAPFDPFVVTGCGARCGPEMVEKRVSLETR